MSITIQPKVNLERGLRFTIGDGQPIERPFTGCSVTGCDADYKAGPELVDEMKRVSTINVEAFDKANTSMRFSIPLTDFAAVHDGPAQEPKQFEETQGKLQGELESRKRKAEERKRRCQ